MTVTKKCILKFWMADFKFIEDKLNGKFVISAPRRAHRPDVNTGDRNLCPFCPGKEKEEQELFRIPASPKTASRGGGGQRGDSNWSVRVLPNKYPFAPIHEIVVHSQDHHKNFGELPNSQVEEILRAYKERFQAHQKEGQVYIFHNRGEKAGESLPHPHSQIVVIPENVKLEIPALEEPGIERVETGSFYIFCPQTSQWPDEVWLAPRNLGEVGIAHTFGDITDGEITDLANSLNRLVQILDLRHGSEFSFNFYIYPKENWYLRLIPRLKTVGGFELGTNVYVNTQDPKETMKFLMEHFENPDIEKIKTIHKASYKKTI